MFYDGEPNYEYRLQMLHRYLTSEMRIDYTCKSNTHQGHHTKDVNGVCNTCVFGCDIQPPIHVNDIHKVECTNFYNLDLARMFTTSTNMEKTLQPQLSHINHVKSKKFIH